jgi:nitrilase
MRVAIVQMNSGPDPEANLKELAPLLEQAANERADLAVLPENFAAMGIDRSLRLALAEQDGDGCIQSALADYARSCGVWIVAGTIPLRSPDPDRIYASSLVYDATGARVARYDKIHLFDVAIATSGETYAESSFTVPGHEPCIVDSPWGTLGIAVCYDLRFPEQFRAMSASGADLLLLPAAFTRATGRAHWEALLRSRAIENQCALIAAAQTGSHADGRGTWGHSLVVDAWGTVQLDMGDKAGVACVSIDLEAQQKLRQEFPALRHRRPDIF